MATGVLDKIRVQPASTGSPELGEGRVYAIAFDMDTEALKKHYGDPYNNAYGEIKKVLVQGHGFSWQQGSVYFGGKDTNAVTCVMAAMDLASRLPWFALSVRDIRMLRIEEMNDLGPAIQKASAPKQGVMFFDQN